MVGPAPTEVSPTRGAVGFIRFLRQLGVEVPVDSAVQYVRALDATDLSVADDVYWVGRITLVDAHDDLGTYDEAFAAYYGHARITRAVPRGSETITLAVDDPDADMGDSDEVADSGPTLQVRYSRVETLRNADLAELNEVERAEAMRLIDQLRFSGAIRRSRRARASRTRHGRPDISRTMQAALRTEGEAIARPRLEPGSQQRRIVLLVDVSGSMESYARGLLRFAGAAVAARRRVEVFALGTRLTRLTRELGGKDLDEALRRAAGAIEDFSGGTRLGAGIQQFNEEWGIRGMARGSVIVILSDGWDRGDPDELAEQLGRLKRVAHELIWVNPLKATPGYAPLARGMAAALPHLDAFVEGHSVASLEDLGRIIAGQS